MPRGDGTGPVGMGPMTGRGMGYCASYAMPGYANAGFGMGCGRGFRRMYRITGLPGWARYCHAGYVQPETDEKEMLAKHAEMLEKELEQVRSRLKELDEEAE